MTVPLAAITDGTTNTMMVSEVIVDWIDNDDRGLLWWGGATSFTALLPPNTKLPDAMDEGGCRGPKVIPCIGNAPGESGQQTYFAARSYHTGGVNVTMCDGSVKFIKNSISYLTYMGLSTSAGTEVISADSY